MQHSWCWVMLDAAGMLCGRVASSQGLAATMDWWTVRLIAGAASRVVPNDCNRLGSTRGSVSAVVLRQRIPSLPAARLGAGLTLPGSRLERRSPFVYGSPSDSALGTGCRQTEVRSVADPDRAASSGRRPMSGDAKTLVASVRIAYPSEVPCLDRPAVGAARRLPLGKQRAIWVGTPACPALDMTPNGEGRKGGRKARPVRRFPAMTRWRCQ